jgi:hypothetical protein
MTNKGWPLSLGMQLTSHKIKESSMLYNVTAGLKIVKSYKYHDKPKGSINGMEFLQ